MTARAFWEAGHRVFGLHGVTNDGQCDCGLPSCTAILKHPRSSKWQNTPHWAEDQFNTLEKETGHLATGYGIVVRGLLVIDVDARNGGVESYANLIERVPAIAGAGLIVETGSGGGSKHLYFKIPEGVALLQHHADFPGVDFKSSGYVVGPGSLHASGNRYVAVVGTPADIDDAPPELIELLRKPERHRAELADGSLIDVAHADIAEMLAVIDPDTDHETWVRCGMAAHHASGGTAFDVWDKWSNGGTKYPGRDKLERRWHSFGKSANPVTLGTLVHYAKAAGWTQSVEFEAAEEAIVRRYAYVPEQTANKSEAPKTDAGEKESNAPRTFEELMKAIHELAIDDLGAIAELIKEANQLPPLNRDAVFQALKERTGIPLRTLRDQSKSDSDNAVDQLDIAKKTIKQIGRDNIICTSSSIWLWDQRGVWRKCEDRQVKRSVQSAIAEFDLSVDASQVNGVLDVLKTEIFRHDHKFNMGDPEAVCCLNGTVALQDNHWKLGLSKRLDYRTTQIPVSFDQSKSAPRFELFLNEVFRDDHDKDEKIAAVLELIGYTLMSHTRHEKFIVLIGSGANGKSVLLSVIESLCGHDNVAAVQPSNFDRSFQRAHLDHKLANIITELRQGEVIADAELKSIVSGEPSTVEHKFGHPFVMHPFSTCWFGTNHMPSTRDFSEALFRRAVIINFNRTFTADEQDKTLKEKLLAELPGILNLATSAYARALVKSFTEPESSRTAKDEWRLEADQVALFIADTYDRHHDGKETFKAVFAVYKNWAIDQNIGKQMTAKGFRNRLEKLGFGGDRTSQQRLVTGLFLKAAPQ